MRPDVYDSTASIGGGTASTSSDKSWSWSWEEKQTLVQRYELHLNGLRFAMDFDRIEDARFQLEAAEDMWKQMDKAWESACG